MVLTAQCVVLQVTNCTGSLYTPGAGDRYSAIDDERSENGLDHLQTLQSRRSHGSTDGNDRLGTGRTRSARYSHPNALRVRSFITE